VHDLFGQSIPHVVKGISADAEHLCRTGKSTRRRVRPDRAAHDPALAAVGADVVFGAGHGVRQRRRDLGEQGGLSGQASVFEMGEYQCGFDDVADLAWAGGDVPQGAPASGEHGEPALAQAPQTRSSAL